MGYPGVGLGSFLVEYQAEMICDLLLVKFGNIDNHSPMRGHMGHPEASQGDLENQPVLRGIDKSQRGMYNLCESNQKSGRMRCYMIL